MTQRLPIGLVLSLRSLQSRHRIATILTVLAIATSVALASGLEMGARAVEREMGRTADLLVGSARLEISGGSVGIPESLLEEIAARSDVKTAAPVIQVTVYLSGEHQGEPLRILGVDLLADQQIRSYADVRRQVRVRDPLFLLAGTQAVIISEILADRLGIDEGDRLEVRHGDRHFELVVRGIFERGGVADAYAGQVAVMDVYSLQELLKRRGWLDRIDVVPEPDTDLETLASSLRAMVDGRGSVRRPMARSRWADSAIETVRLAVVILALVGVLTASIVSFGTLSLSVQRRLREFALLRAVGLESSRVRQLIWTESLVLAGVGTLLGLWAGILLSDVFVQAFSVTLQHIENVPVTAVPPRALTFVIGVGVGVGVALLGTLLPVWQSTSRPPMQVMQERRSEPDVVPGSGLRPAWIAGLAVLGLAAGFGMEGVPATLRVGVLFLTGLAGVGLVLEPALKLLLEPIRAALERVWPGFARLAGAGLLARIAHTRVTLVAIVGSVAGLIGMLIVVESMVWSIDAWQSDGVNGGILVTRPATQSMERDDLSYTAVEAIRSLPGVRALSESVGAHTLYRGESIQLHAYTRSAFMEYGSDRSSIGVPPEELTRALLRGEVSVTEQFARSFDVERGDFITLNTPKGVRRFRVAATSRSFMDGVGGISMDLRTFDRIWERSGVRSLLVWPSGSAEELVDQIRKTVGPSEPLFFTHGENLENYARNVLARFNRLFYTMIGLTGILGALAIANMMVSSVLERRRELLLLRAVGASARQLGRLVVCDGLLLSTIGIGLGLLLGFALAVPMAAILTDAFGWTVTFVIPWLQILALAACGAGGTLLMGAYPAWVARRSVGRLTLAF